MNVKDIDINKMVIDSLLNNKILLISIASLFSGYWIQDILFSRQFSKILTNIPDFMKTLSFSSILSILFPYIVANFLFLIDDMIIANSFPKMETDIIHNILDKIIESIKTTKAQINVNELMLNLKNIMDIKNIYLLIIVYIFPTILIGTALLFYFFCSDVKYGIILLSMITLFIMLNVKMESNCINISRQHENKIDKLYDEIQDLMSNHDTVITSNTKNKELSNISKHEKECCIKHTASEMKGGEITFNLSSLSLLLMMAIDGLAIKMHYDGKISTDLLVTTCMLSYSFIQYYNSSVFKFKSVLHYIGRYKELDSYFSEFSIHKNASKNVISVKNGEVVFKNVQVIHDKKVMPNVLNFTIKGKSRVGIIGEIGTGKTSVLKILCGLKKYNGTVTIDGINLKDFSHESITNNVIYIPQHPKLFNRTIYDNLAYGTNYNQQQISDLITKLKLNKFFDKFEKGILSNVGKEGGKLSGGQKQIMALIRAIIQQKQIILLDEPTSSLDTETKTIFIELVDSIKDKTIIVVTHDKTIYNLFDEMIEL